MFEKYYVYCNVMYDIGGDHHACVMVVVSVTERVGGNSLFVAVIDSESVAIATLWRFLTPTVSVNSFGLKEMCPIMHGVIL